MLALFICLFHPCQGSDLPVQSHVVATAIVRIRADTGIIVTNIKYPYKQQKHHSNPPSSMAPVTVTSTGVARQTIDDPNLIALIERLSKFYPSAAAAADVLVDATNTVAGDGDAPSAAGSAVVYVATNNAAGATDGDIIMADAVPGDGVSPATVPMATSTTRSTGESESTSQPQQPPLDVKSLVAELDSVPKWQFQELVSD